MYCLRVIPKYRNTVFEVIEGVKNTHLIYKTLMEKRGNEIHECDDLMAMFMKEMRKRTNNEDSHYFTEKQCCFLLSDLFGAGVETSVNTLRWFLLYMALNQEIQVIITSFLKLLLEYRVIIHRYNHTCNSLLRIFIYFLYNMWFILIHCKKCIEDNKIQV